MSAEVRHSRICRCKKCRQEKKSESVRRLLNRHAKDRQQRTGPDKNIEFVVCNYKVAVAGDDSPVDRACAWLDKVKTTLREKNRAYGNSASDPIRIFSKLGVDAGLRVRMDDKLSRIARGDGSGNEDALADFVGYAAFLATVKE
jgi:hypothetical protein